MNPINDQDGNGSVGQLWRREAIEFFACLVIFGLFFTVAVFEDWYDVLIEESLGLPRWVGGTIWLALLGLVIFALSRVFRLTLGIWRRLLGIPLILAAIGIFGLTPIANYAYPRGEFYFTGDYIEYDYGRVEPIYEEDLSTVDIPRWVRTVRTEPLLDPVFGIVYGLIGGLLIAYKRPRG